jgi:isoamylase
VAATPKRFEVDPGRPHPLGARPDKDGVNFSLYSAHATTVELLLFDEHDDVHPAQVIRLDPSRNRTFFFWHCHVQGLRPGAHYAYRLDGPRDPETGHRFNPNKVLIDPYAFGNTDALWDRKAACGPGDNLASSMRSVVVDLDDYDWEGDRPLNRPMADTVVYEIHVGGFTRCESSGVRAPGTFSGIVEKIPYLRDLGVTAVELLPVFEFDSRDILRTLPDGRPLRNYWGYSTLGFFAPDAGYCTTPEAGSHIREFRDMVKALHRAGLEVILDVVFNHTDEGNHEGPSVCFKGMDNRTYYHLVNDRPQYYMDFSGCGNTLNCNHPIVQKMILECLQFWVEEMHVDGFRFDEGSILSRGEDGAPMLHPPVIWSIELAETLADTKLIAEAWDAAGLYQIGQFPGMRWAEWNGRFRDDVRAFVAGRPGIVGRVASRLGGSADLYQASGRRPVNSVNFVTCHDGFTLNDLVSYDVKHNEDNGEGNRDGIDENQSWNCGFEGPSNDPALERFRDRQIKNFCATLLLARGVPMILAGDEMRRTQDGNNNAYCQDNAVSWIDWSNADAHVGVLRFFRKMIAFRRAHAVLASGEFFDGAFNARGLPDVRWHGCRLDGPGWNDPGCRVLALTLGDPGDGADLHIVLNMDDQELEFEVPTVPGRTWRRVVDTARDAPIDIVEERDAPPVHGAAVRVSGRSVVVLVAHE